MGGRDWRPTDKTLTHRFSGPKHAVQSTLWPIHSFTAWLQAQGNDTNRQRAGGKPKKTTLSAIQNTRLPAAANMGGRDWRPTDKTLTGGHIRDSGHVPLIHRLVEFILRTKTLKKGNETNRQRARGKPKKTTLSAIQNTRLPAAANMGGRDWRPTDKTLTRGHIVTLATSHSFTAWLKLFAYENTEEGQRNQQAEGRRETEENNIVSYTKHATASCCKHVGP